MAGIHKKFDFYFALTPNLITLYHLKNPIKVFMDISIMPLYCYIIYLLQCFDSFSLSSMSLLLCLSFSYSSHSTYYYFFYVSLLIDLYSSELCLKLIRMVFFLLLLSRFVFFFCIPLKSKVIIFSHFVCVCYAFSV